LIGSSAFGCEFLKDFALMGVSTDPLNKIFVTDMYQIEKSNLTKQFLFRLKILVN
jgi:ubiquitin-activating enzyme E1